MCKLDIDGDLISYADDTAIVFNSESLDDLVVSGLAKIADWLDKNGMALSIKKPKFMHFSIGVSRKEITVLRLHNR